MRAGSSNPSEGKRRPHARGRCGWGQAKRLLAKGNGPGAEAPPARLHSCSWPSALLGVPLSRTGGWAASGSAPVPRGEGEAVALLVSGIPGV